MLAQVPFFLLATLVAAALAQSVKAASDSPVATEGVAISGSVSNSTISNTVNRENPATLAMLAKALRDRDISEDQRRQAQAKAAELGTKLGFTSAAVAEFFKILGEQNVPDEKVPARLIEIAMQFTQTRDMLAGRPGPDEPHAAELVRSAKEALNTGMLAEADGLLDQAKAAEVASLREARELKQKAQESEDRHALNAAKLLADRGNIALTQLRYAEAVKRFDEAAALVPPNYPDEAAAYLERKGDVLEREGDDRGDPSALEQSIETYRHVLQLRSRDRAPLAWAKTQSSLGLSLRLHGEFVSGTVDLQEAILAFRAALAVQSRDREPLQWADTETRLGTALLALGGRERRTAHLQEAITAYHAALEEEPRDQVPDLWAVTQDRLGRALLSLGGQEGEAAHLEEAIATFRAVLGVWTRDRAPLAWAVAQNDLGNALRLLGERESGTAHLEEAVAAYRAVLEVRTRERIPLYWASTQYDLGLALRTLGERESGTAHLEEAIAAWEACLTVTAWPQSRVQEVHSRIDQALVEQARRAAK